MTRDVWRTTREISDQARLTELAERHRGMDADAVLASVVSGEFAGRIALVSSFGTEAAVLLHLVSEVDPATPVVFLDSGKLFDETLRYRDRLVDRLGLRDVRTIRPGADHLRADDPDGTLHESQPDLCCHVRKTLPLLRALREFDAWITGRKRHHGGERTELPLFEMQDGRVKVNPLILWDRERLVAEFQRRGLPRHPLEAAGYLSVGCIPCTIAVADGQDTRAGRWAGSEKTECGIHFSAEGNVLRQPR